MSDYITPTELNHFLLNAAQITNEKKAFVITAASRYFDRLAEVEEDFFQVAGDNATEKIFKGNGLSLLPLPPYVGQLGNVVEDGDVIDTNSYWTKGIAPNQYIEFESSSVKLNYPCYDFNHYRPVEYWRKNENYTISARWGWSVVPYEVKCAVAEIAIALSSGLDLARAITLEESFAKLPMVAPNGFADRASRYYRERLITIGI